MKQAEIKAIELFNKFHKEVYPNNISKNQAKQCALICVDEILLQIENWGIVSVKRFWQEVKNHIEKL